MTTQNSFDSITTIKRLVKNDFSQKQAEAIAVEFKNIRNEFNADIVSQQFFDTTLKYYAKRLEGKIASSKSEMLKWFIGASLTQSSLLVVFIIGILDFLLKKM